MESETIEKPEYLYKILPFRLWQSTQNTKAVLLSSEDATFIHFSTEDQLDKIIKKYWSNVPQFVILKIETDKLEGNLVYETNPGGSIKYYHLYKGFIPFNSILEAKIVYHQSPESSGLPIVEIGDPILRRAARELSIEEILTPKIQSLIQDMKNTMRAAPGVGLAAPQIGNPIQLIVIEDVDQRHLTSEQLLTMQREVVAFHVIINPRLYIDSADTASFYEGCLSVPGFMGIVPRAKSVRVECLNEKAEPLVIHAKGWYARILQHEIDHLNSTLYLDRTMLPTLTTQENYIKIWKGKDILEVLKQTLPKQQKD